MCSPASGSHSHKEIVTGCSNEIELFAPAREEIKSNDKYSARFLFSEAHQHDGGLRSYPDLNHPTCETYDVSSSLPTVDCRRRRPGIFSSTARSI